MSTSSVLWARPRTRLADRARGGVPVGGKIVLIGGRLASLYPEVLRPHADILVIGELEEIAPHLSVGTPLHDQLWKEGLLFEGERRRSGHRRAISYLN